MDWLQGMNDVVKYVEENLTESIRLDVLLKIVDIALKYCYESQATFTRAFKELHGQTPLSVS